MFNIIFKSPAISAGLLCFFLLTPRLSAQYLIPYLGANGQYGFANEQGRLIVPPVLDRCLEVIYQGKPFHKCSKTGEPVLVTLSGQVIPIKDYVGTVSLLKHIPNLLHRDSITFLNQLLHVELADSIQLVNLQNNGRITLPKTIGLYSPEWFEKTGHYEPGFYPWIYTANAMLIARPDEKINFLDTSLNVIFPRDFAAGIVADENYMIVADGPRQFGIAAKDGKLMTDLIWPHLKATEKSGVFIVNKPPFFDKTLKATGLMNFDGRLILDTIYHNLINHASFWLVCKEDSTAVFNVETQQLGRFWPGRPIEYFCENVILEDEHKEIYLLDRLGASKLPGTGYRFIHHTLSYLALNQKEEIVVLDQHLKEILRTKGTSASVGSDEPVVITVVSKASGREQYRLFNQEGKPVFSEFFSEIKYAWKNAWLVKKDSLWGILDSNGTAILPLKYAAISVEYTSGNAVIWIKEKKEHLWSAVDKNGKPLHFNKRLEPSSLKNPVFLFLGGDNTGKVLTLDGSIRLLPDSLKKLKILKHTASPVGGFAVFQNIKSSAAGVPRPIYLNEKFNNIIPEGFCTNSLFDFENNIEQSGLLTVFHQTPGDAAPETSEPTIEEPYGRLKGDLNFPIPRLGACGVLNARGEWVMPPKKGVRYIPLSHYLIAEVNIRRNISVHAGPMILHRVNQNRQEKFSAHAISRSSFEASGKPMAFYNAEQKIAYYNDHGEQITPFEFDFGPAFLQDRNLVAQQMPDKQQPSKRITRQKIISQQGKVTAELGDLLSKDPKFEIGPDRLKYFIVKDRISGLEGLMDSVGNLIIPARYANLEVLRSERLLAAKMPDGKYQLLSWQNRPLEGTFDTAPESAYPTREGIIIVYDKQKSILLDKNLQKIAEIPGAFVQFSDKINGKQRYALFRDAGRSLFFAEILTGLFFRA